MENPQVFIITPRKELFIPPQASSFPKASPQQKKKKMFFYEFMVWRVRKNLGTSITII